ncbi:hypothetical protein KY290_026186 [Solanum tuberosum]|uniref:GAG-pre-integrase domain-containing protein n=1 Tax=Solanum tuberosum TaxID=4113 RepID=A0ABQ7UXQ0_SOLTU|nr:hypothetical protein KY290_026186 [Solanum tuberosum]
MQKNIGTKASPNVTFVKHLATLRRIAITSNRSKQFFVKNGRKKRKKTFSLLLNLMLQQKKKNVASLLSAFKNEVVDDSWLWHKRFCHLSFHGLKLLKKKDMVQGLPEIHTEMKVENTSIISLDVLNQEEDEVEEDIPQGEKSQI